TLDAQLRRERATGQHEVHRVRAGVRERRLCATEEAAAATEARLAAHEAVHLAQQVEIGAAETATATATAAAATPRLDGCSLAGPVDPAACASRPTTTAAATSEAEAADAGAQLLGDAFDGGAILTRRNQR